MSANTTVTMTVNTRTPPSSAKISSAEKAANIGTQVASSTAAAMSRR